MKTSLEWLREFTPGPLDPAAAAEALTNGGLNVDGVESHGDDVVLEVEVTSNRGDCLSHVGVARDLAALMGREFRDFAPAAGESGSPAASIVSVRIDAPSLCPHYTARVIRGVKIGPSPAWMARRLEAVGLRPINNVVDATNYVLFETGQPLHAFDLARVGAGAGGARAGHRMIVVREAKRGEKLVTLDGREHALSPPMLVIADEEKPLALAGVMGGAASEVTATTVDVLLESARFDPLSVRKTARALAARSDSSYRFERGIDPALPPRASLRAAQLILETAGGMLAPGLVSAGEAGPQPRTLSLRLSQLKRVLGVELPLNTVVDVLARLHLSPNVNGDRIDVQAPSWRLDLNIEADLVEEVIRLVGFDKVPVRPEISIRLAPPDLPARALETIRQVLIAGGYFEAVTFSFVSDALRADFMPAVDPAGVRVPLRADAAVRKADATLRPSLIPGLLEAVRRNETNGVSGARLFETGSAFLSNPDGTPDERRKLGLVGGGDWRDVRGVVESVLNRLDVDRPVQFVPDARVGFARGAVARVEWGGKAVGYAGRVDRAVAEKLGLRELPVAAELDLPELNAGARHVPQLRPLAEFPAARRDLSLVLDEDVRYEKVEAAVREAVPPNLEDVEYVTTYRGKPLPAGKKSVTLTLVFRSPAATLTGEQVEAGVAKVVAAAGERLGATLRE